MNETLNPTPNEMVYTSPRYDVNGGGNRYIERGSDQWYPGTCEADVVCDTDTEAQAEACSEGYVCDETTNSSEAGYYLCREGYACDFGATPDRDLHAPQSQFTHLCPAGYACADGTGLGQSLREPCLEGYFCPTGTAEPRIGSLADDSINRLLTAAGSSPRWLRRSLIYLTDDDQRLISDHDGRCFEGVDDSLRVRWDSKEPPEAAATTSAVVRQPRAGGEPAVVASIDLRKPSLLNQAKSSNIGCGRDHKWHLVESAINRNECDCERQLYVTIAVYRLWKCTNNGTILPLGLASLAAVNVEQSTGTYHGGRDYWFGERSNRTSRQCFFNRTSDRSTLNLTHGVVPTSVLLADAARSSQPGMEGALNLSKGLSLSLTASDASTFSTYAELYAAVTAEYEAQKAARLADEIEAIDPYTFDLHTAVANIEQHGEYLEQLVILWRKTADINQADAFDQHLPKRIDLCECQHLLRCPNGTSSPEGSTSIFDCKPCCSGTRDETAADCWSSTKTCTSRVAVVLKRIDALPSWSVENYAGTGLVEKRVDSDQDPNLNYTELTGTTSDSLGHVRLSTFDVASMTFDLRELSNNLTYGQHYRLSVYEDCKPCPTSYAYTDGVATVFKVYNVLSTAGATIRPSRSAPVSAATTAACRPTRARRHTRSASRIGTCGRASMPRSPSVSSRSARRAKTTLFAAAQTRRPACRCQPPELA